MSGVVYLGQRPVGPAGPVYIIAEIGLNHNGEGGLGRALGSHAFGTRHPRH